MENVSVTRSLALNRVPGGAVIGVRGENFGKIVCIRPEVEILLGRDTNLCDIFFHNGKVSRKHCGIVYHLKENAYSVYDYSTNGTYVKGGKRLKRGGNHGIPPGTELYIGTTEDVIKLG